MLDWFTLSAQIVNFLILIWLLKRFLYQPILQALDAREAKIKAGLQEAEEKKQQAQLAHDEFLRKTQEFDQQRAALLKTAQAEANSERQRLLKQAREDAEILRLQQEQGLKTQQQQFFATLSQRIETEVFAMARQALTDLAEVSLEEQMIAVFMAKLQQWSESEKQQMLAEINVSNTPLLIRTAFELSPSQMTELEQAVQNLFGRETHLQFKTSVQLISGIELSSDGQKIAWAVNSYFHHFENQLNEMLPLR
jgi:F-type H+-transporting ATPase subunit b